MTPDGERITGDLAALARFGADGAGVTRPAFSAADLAARVWLSGRMRDCGLDPRVDAAGNVIGRAGPSGPAVVIGSHIDSVPSGGTLDGALGVVAGLECARVLLCEGSLPRALEVIAFADEEGRFHSHLGSLAMSGALQGTDLDGCTDATGVALTDAFDAAGLAVGRLAEAARPPEDIATYLELHIEQGPVLERDGLPVGIVDVIAGVERLRLRFTGRADHGGAAPHADRRDPMLAAAGAMLGAERDVLAAGGEAARATFGWLTASPGVDCVVPGVVELSLELRHPGARLLGRCREAALAAARTAAESRGVALAVRELTRRAPTRLTPALVRAGHEAAAALGLPARTLASGAGHDAQSFAPHSDTALVFIRSRDGRSHCPEEYSDPSDIEAGARLLLALASAALGVVVPVKAAVA